LKKFHGQIAIGAGSYNAGPRAMMKWLQRNKDGGDRPFDEFVELCPYTQTREYMKKALDIYARYVYLYEKEDYLPPDKVDTSPLDDGIDY
jgi:soluble lytic murein transglycosylase-like protein